MNKQTYNFTNGELYAFQFDRTIAGLRIEKERLPKKIKIKLERFILKVIDSAEFKSIQKHTSEMHKTIRKEWEEEVGEDGLKAMPERRREELFNTFLGQQIGRITRDIVMEEDSGLEVTKSTIDINDLPEGMSGIEYGIFLKYFIVKGEEG